MAGDLATFGGSLMLAERLALEEAGAAGAGRLPAPVAAALVDAGAACAGQSAFGPACYGIVASEAEADAVVARLSRRLEAREARARLFVTAPDNDGARVASK